MAKQPSPEPIWSPLSVWDEYPIHQATAPIRYVGTSDLRAFERYWFTAQARDGSAFLITGMGVYPNLGIIDAYALLVYEGKQVTIRAHEQLRPDRATLSVNALRFDPVKPFQQWNLVLGGNNDLDFSFDLNWFDSKRPRFGKPNFASHPGAAENIHLIHDWGGYESFGSVEGTVHIGGKALNLSRDMFIGSRDHHWGIRDGVGGINIPTERKSYGHVVHFVEFRDWAMWGDLVMHNMDSPKKPSLATPVGWQIGFDPETRHFREAIVKTRLADGEIKTLHFKAFDHMAAYLRCGGYCAPDGRGSPLGNYSHGLGTGPAVVTDMRDIRDPKCRSEICGFEDVLCEVTCDGEKSVGIFECMNPALYDLCNSGAPGFSFL